MAEYIDRDLIEWRGCDFENASCENRDCSGCSHAEVSHAQVMQIPIADVVERSKINDAIEEFEQEYLKNCMGGLELCGMFSLVKVMKIIRKHMGE